MRHVTCCLQCVAPKRHPGCHDKCPEIRAELDAENERLANIRATGNREYTDYFAKKITKYRDGRRK